MNINLKLLLFTLSFYISFCKKTCELNIFVRASKVDHKLFEIKIDRKNYKNIENLKKGISKFIADFKDDDPFFNLICEKYKQKDIETTTWVKQVNLLEKFLVGEINFYDFLDDKSILITGIDKKEEEGNFFDLSNIHCLNIFLHNSTKKIVCEDLSKVKSEYQKYVEILRKYICEFNLPEDGLAMSAWITSYGLDKYFEVYKPTTSNKFMIRLKDEYIDINKIKINKTETSNSLNTKKGKVCPCC